MTFVLLLAAAVLLLALFVFMELTELASAMIFLILLSSGGVYVVDPTTAWLAFGTVALAAVVVIGLLVYRYLGNRAATSESTPMRDGGGSGQ
jgi:membrane protein implicated in regulation of membrane protease activity